MAIGHEQKNYHRRLGSENLIRNTTGGKEGKTMKVEGLGVVLTSLFGAYWIGKENRKFGVGSKKG